jgi:hypothetical protein
VFIMPAVKFLQPISSTSCPRCRRHGRAFRRRRWQVDLRRHVRCGAREIHTVWNIRELTQADGTAGIAGAALKACRGWHFFEAAAGLGSLHEVAPWRAQTGRGDLLMPISSMRFRHHRLMPACGGTCSPGAPWASRRQFAATAHDTASVPTQHILPRKRTGRATRGL